MVEEKFELSGKMVQELGNLTVLLTGKCLKKLIRNLPNMENVGKLASSINIRLVTKKKNNKILKIVSVRQSMMVSKGLK